MKKIKSLLISKMGKLDKEKVYNLSKLPYTKNIILYSGNKDIENLKVIKNIEIIKINNLNELNKQISLIHKKYYDYTVLPNFKGDDNSKYAIKIYNKTFGTKIDPKIFKEKDKMAEFLGDIVQKKFIKYKLKDLKNENFDKLISLLGETFIVKPINASSSTNTFKIASKEDFDNVKNKLSKEYDYILEEYIGGSLFSIDLFFDGEKMFLLTLVREVAMIELSEKKKFSNKFIEKYGEEMEKHFNFILPLGYNLDFSKLSTTEINFLEKIRNKLEQISYKGIIHLEYKYDSTTKKLGFLERGARHGGYRTIFIKEIYNTDALKIPYYILIDKDYSRFSKLKGQIYKFKEKEHNLNFVRVKTNFTEKVNYVKILKKSGDIFNNSFNSFLKDYYKNKFSINTKKIDFFVKYDKDYSFYPFYKNNNTMFDYLIELNDENFSIFKNKKFKIIEEIFFHDYR